MFLLEPSQSFEAHDSARRQLDHRLHEGGDGGELGGRHAIFPVLHAISIQRLTTGLASAQFL